MKATLFTYRQSPRKVRLVADVIRGKRVSHALEALRFLKKRASAPMLKLLQSAVSNAKNNNNITEDALLVSEVRVDRGATLKRYRSRARGRASRINKRTSHITISLAEEIKQ